MWVAKRWLVHTQIDQPNRLSRKTLACIGCFLFKHAAVFVLFTIVVAILVENSVLYLVLLAETSSVLCCQSTWCTSQENWNIFSRACRLFDVYLFRFNWLVFALDVLPEFFRWLHQFMNCFDACIFLHLLSMYLLLRDWTLRVNWLVVSLTCLVSRWNSSICQVVCFVVIKSWRSSNHSRGRKRIKHRGMHANISARVITLYGRCLFSLFIVVNKLLRIDCI